MTKSIRARRLAALVIVSLCVALLLAGCLSTPTITQDAAPSQPGADELDAELKARIEQVRGNVPELASMIHQRVNAERAANGMTPLQWDPQLASIALSHSQDMAQRDYFDHISPDGDDFEDRYRRNGYTRQSRIGDQVYIGGENLFLNNVMGSYTYNQVTGEVQSYEFNSLEELASSTVEGWMDSPGHRENIMTPFSREGIGVFVDSDGEVYITENFS